MKIVHEINQLDFGGVEKVVRNIIKFDKKNEHTIISYKDGPYRKHLEEAGAKIILLEGEDNDELDMEADVIHIHCGGDISNLARSIGRQFAVVETIHSPVRSPNHSSLIAQRVGVSEAVARMNVNAKVIHNGLDFEAMVPRLEKDVVMQRMGWDPSKPIVGRLGRLGKDKGLEEWILACYELQCQGVQFTPVIIGSEARNCKGYRGQLKLMCESLPLKGVTWLSNQEDISDYLQCMDVFLYPSPTEGFGLVFVEAMHNGSVVVSYDNDVNREIIGGYSVLVKKESGILGLVAGVKKAFTTEIRDEIQGMQEDFVHEQYDAENMSLAYQEIYEQCYVNFNGANASQEEHVVSS